MGLRPSVGLRESFSLFGAIALLGGIALTGCGETPPPAKYIAGEVGSKLAKRHQEQIALYLEKYYGVPADPRLMVPTW